MESKFTLLALLAITLVLAPRLALAQDNETGEVEDPGILPGNPFYDLKLLIEKLKLMLTFNQKAKIRLNMKLAEKRLAEAEQMMLKNKTQAVERLMVRYEECVEQAEQTRERLRLRNITLEDVDEYMNQTTSKHIAVIQRVMQNTPEQAQSGLRTALQNAEMNKERIKTRITERIERRAGEAGAATQTQEQTGTQSGQSGQGQSD